MEMVRNSVQTSDSARIAIGLTYLLGAAHRLLEFNLEVRMDMLTWLIVGLIAGLLASAVVGGIGYGILGDIIVGIVGAVIGGWLFTALRVSSPVGGLPGTVLVAFIGAVVLLVLIRMLRPGRRLV